VTVLGLAAAPVEPVVLDQRPAIDGTTITRGARLHDENGDPIIDNQGNPVRSKQGQPFTMMSRADAANYYGAIALYHQYVQLVGPGAALPGGRHVAVYDLVQGGVSMASRGFQVAVLSVEMLRAARLSRSIGYLNGGGAILECRWQLLAIGNDSLFG